MAQPGVPKTVYLELSGKCKYLNFAVVDQFGKWGTVLYPTSESLDIIKKMQDGWLPDVEGIKNELKLDEEGSSIRLNRPVKKETRFKTISFGPPLLLDKDGKTPLVNTMVGNGSDITANVELYFFKTPTKRLGSAMRLISARVDNLVPYSGKEDLTPDQQKMVGRLDINHNPTGWP